MEATEDYCASNGQCSPGKENSRMLADMSAPNGQTVPQGPNSPCELTIKQEEEINDEADNRSPAPEDIGQMGDDAVALEESMTGSPSSNVQDGLSGPNATADAGHRQSNGDRPFQCNQCGVSFTQKGNLLRHIKLHTGEKPFKCPFCSYACRRRDALTGHLRTHAVGKPHKCNYCGRSYKQRTSLEEHKERCHGYLQSIGLDANTNTGHFTGEVPKDPRPMADANSMANFDRPPVIERLHSNVGKRKSTTPQKFVGEKMARYSYPDMAEIMPGHMMDQAINNAITYLGSDSLRPMLHHPGPPLSMAEVVPMVNPLFHHVLPLGQRTERPGNCDGLPPQPPPPHEFPSHPISNGPTALTKQGKLPHPGHEESPSNSGMDSADSARSSPQDKHGYHGSNAPSLLRSRASPAVVYPGERIRDASPRSGVGIMRVGAERSVSQEGVRVFGREGQQLRAFQCEHCQVLFLDHVMYTIHMGCHGYRDPMECNICGHRSKDRYEFSSHIVRGEHTFQ
ncbi:zinc finger protein Helios [Parambassis ranga]|uniref:Zinc finger protein Helios-like n=1 Tax=Parambassis ranga TaxID=210632 RepID=A0A6P7H4D4_9TELE|nr:zinc finger protein Helios-like [Parambassis ranga]XP_028249248.1 zinc finger protein Helios-like [Parambassis ranga]XP_028249249.1 zinc finger protein Helios-like [Parambassis ranga]XP_028249250.1 zinc finger protein Helios-like [Parambassis ranga]XP_028249251.1 zinc finger protein Helios-like [Parambassis ranga]XP_028249252.1 zinc finger protein Helios-like [Parambassis ranga]